MEKKGNVVVNGGATSRDNVARECIAILAEFVSDGISLSEDTELMDLGIDSLDWTEVLGQVNRRMQVHAMPTLVLEITVVRDLIEWVAGQHVQNHQSVSTTTKNAKSYDDITRPMQMGPSQLLVKQSNNGAFSSNVAATTTTTSPFSSPSSATVMRGFERLSPMSAQRREEETKRKSINLKDITLGVIDVVVSGGFGEQADIVDVKEETDLNELGIDSLDFVELLRAVGTRFGVDAPPTLVLEVQSVGQLAAYVHGQLTEGEISGREDDEEIGEGDRLHESSHNNSAYDSKAATSMHQSLLGRDDGKQQPLSSFSSKPVSPEQRRALQLEHELNVVMMPQGVTQMAVNILGSLLRLSVYAAGFVPIVLIEERTHFFSERYNRVEARSALELAVWFSGMLTLWTACSMIALIIFKWLIVGRYREGNFHRWSWEGARYGLYDLVGGLDGPIGWVFNSLPDPIQRTYFRALGATIGSDVTLHGEITTGYDLIKIGNGAVIESGSSLNPSVTEDGVFVQYARITVGAESLVAIRSRVGPGACLGQRAMLAPYAFAQGYVPPLCVVTGENSYLKKPNSPGYKRVPQSALAFPRGGVTMFCLEAVAFIYLAFCSGLCIMSGFLVRAAVAKAIWEGIDKDGEEDGGGGVIKWDFWSITMVLTIALLGAMQACVFPVALINKYLFTGRVRAGRRALTQLLCVRHKVAGRLIALGDMILLAYFESTPVQTVW
eukprot:jgi/Bigna1/132096/aug1.16_g6804